MKTILILLLAQLSFSQVAFAQADAAPQEAPYIQEDNEFDVFSNEGVKASEESDALSIENEIKKPAEKKEAVDLNAPSDKQIEDDLLLEENNAEKVATPEEPVPFSEPIVEEVKPYQKVPKSSKTMRSAKGGVEYIEHPQAAQGLRLITKEGAYIYRTEDKKEHEYSGAFRFGMMDPPNITAAVASGGTPTTFADMYSGNQQPVINFDFEWQPFRSFGKLGVQTGFGLMYATGNGRFITDGKEAKEKYTFLAVPLSLGVTYRLEWTHRQWIAPYVSGGGTYVGVAEVRDDGKSNFTGAPGAYGGGGILFSISAASRETAFTLQSEYGIQNLWVSLDYKYLKTFNEDLDFSSNVIGGGIVCDY